MRQHGVVAPEEPAVRVGGVVEVDAAFEDRVGRYAQVPPDRGHLIVFGLIWGGGLCGGREWGEKGDVRGLGRVLGGGWGMERVSEMGTDIVCCVEGKVR